MALSCVEWIAAQLKYFAKQQSGFRHKRSTADSFADVVATLEDARGSGHVAMLLLPDVQSAFDQLSHEVIEAALDYLGVTVCLRGFISAFLVDQSFRLWDSGAGLPAGSRYPFCGAICTHDVALWVRGPRGSVAAVRASLQKALETATSFIGGFGLSVCPAKTEAILVHPLGSVRHYVKQLRIANTTIPWKRQVTYVGLTIDHRLSWMTAAKAVTIKVRRVHGAVGKMLQHGRAAP
ncbi:uncharacterized protein LOC142575061 [Dermacentor variabilis]|uniref:uncharacterized protein LOC142575061 n=1 Tax=Dermacentor variabilis TaxID=34621 RepID=UPI003F5C1135